MKNCNSFGRSIRLISLVLTVGIFFVPELARADSVSGNITNIAATLMPTSVVFIINNTPQLACQQSGLWPSYSGSPETNKAVFASVLAAYLSGKVITITIDPNTCVVTWLMNA